MAGIGFELRKILRKDTISSNITAYAIAAIISSGPWVISIIGILFLGVIIGVIPAYHISVSQVQVSITYLIACSLILSGFAQHSFTRYVADQLFLNKSNNIIPNLNGMMLLLTAFSGVIGLIAIIFFLPGQNVLYRLLMLGSFVVLCNIWMTTNLLAGLKDYKTILLSFLLSYGIVFGLGYYLRKYGLQGFMLAFFIGQVLLLISFLFSIYKFYPAQKFLDFHFLKPGHFYFSLVVTSFCYNLGIWIDKFIFWFAPTTSYSVIGFLRGSLIYDVPIFIAYLALIPGMAVFLLRVEADFAYFYQQFFEAIREGQTLSQIRAMRDQMTNSAQDAIVEIIKVQMVTIIFIFLLGDKLLHLLHISTYYKNLLYIDVVGASLQVVLLAILNILFYLDRRNQALKLCVMFVVLNFIFTLITIYYGPLFYGYGFTLALTFVCAYGTHILNSELSDLDYKAIMLR